MPFLTATTISGIVGFAKSNLSSYILKKGLDAGLASLEPKLKQELEKVINDTLIEYERSYPIAGNGNKFPFYHSQRVVSELLSFRIMHKEEYDLNGLVSALESEPNVTPPTKQQIEDFFELFRKNVEQTTELKKLEISETYKEEIFFLSRQLKGIQSNLENIFDNYKADLELQWKDRLNTYVSTLQAFKPETALNLLDSFLQSLETSGKKPSVQLQATIFYQRGICLKMLGRRDEASKAFIQAFATNSESLMNMEQAGIAYFRLGDLGKASPLSAALLEKDEFNSVGWALEVALCGMDDIAQMILKVPLVVKRDIAFHATLFNLLAAHNSHEKIHLLKASGELPTYTDYVPRQVSVNNLSEHGFWLNMLVGDFFSNFYFEFTSLENPDKKELIYTLNGILERYLEVMSSSEIKEEHARLRFLLAYTNYFKSREDKYIPEMKTWYDKLPKKELHFSLLAANVFQQAGHEDMAIDILEKSEVKSVESLMLLSFCYLKTAKTDLYTKTVKDLCTLLTDVPSVIAPTFANYILELKRNGVQNEFTVSDFIDGKTFEAEQDKSLITLMSKILIEGGEEKDFAELKELGEQLDDERYLGLIATTFYLSEKNEEAVLVFRKFINREEEGRDLYHYIRSLYNTKKDNKELLKLLESWRLNASFDPSITRLELQEFSQLGDLEKFQNVAAYYLENSPQDEMVQVRYVHALFQINTQESLAKLSALVPALVSRDYSSSENAKLIGQVLIKTKHFGEGFELLYKYASNPSDKSARMAFFMAFTEYREVDKDDWPVKEFNTVEEGHFVKYSIDGRIFFIELNQETLKQQFARKFLGCNKGGAFTVSRPVTGEEDLVYIERIMDKYLYLHDQIIEEVDTNPYSGLPMTAFRIDPENVVESMENFLQKVLGDSGSQRKEFVSQKLKEYYDEGLPYGEVIMSVMDGRYLPGYYELANRQGGINALPIIAFDHPVPERYLLDLSSLPMIYQISKNHGIEFHERFVISKYLVDHIKEELLKAKEGGNALSMTVTNDSLTPQMLSEEQQKFNIEYLEGILDWVNEHCEVRLTERVLDVVRSMELGGAKDEFVQYYLNTPLLLEDDPELQLVSDDLIYYRLGTPAQKLISTEYFVKRSVPVDDRGLDEFIKNRYKHFTPSVRQLNEQFSERTAGRFHQYDRCLENLSIMDNPGNALTGIQHIRWMVLDSFMGEEELSAAVHAIFRHMLKRVTLPAVKQLLRLYIEQEFRLLGRKLDFVIDALNRVIRETRL